MPKKIIFKDRNSIRDTDFNLFLLSTYFKTLLITTTIALGLNMHSAERASYGNCYISLGYIHGSLPSRVVKFVDNTGIDPTKMEVFERKDKKLYFTLGQIDEDIYKLSQL